MIDTDVALFETSEQAEALRGGLLRSGFDSVVVVERGGFFAVMAQSDDPERLLKASEASGVEGMLKCPACGSPWISYPSSPQASPTAAGVKKVLDAVGSAVMGIDPSAHCNACAHEWAPKHGGQA